ncbi:Stk1 family PASTA domain-containing Ser/Thr kinase [Gemelliphila palaticanis]|uniref:non-specific serine/threonine protein kinase n=1 Tax=Gemelliphila palaticanis TaxID=81950 RepID=A0ABX2SZ60_9BACL|nr:Stk1 family PASTA domain-containing Ser/Thr kinase [Gemella palaticanis]MBF0715730.1 Stk1 family PASTA domain-containing Ser/Thr kinase [Gemella palaticanis]NYS47660.1 Stk1 family PASTA domain-containing Ser/Thr kinase [Gemella palaticanis]
MIGKIVCDRYKIIEHLGTGGMATVWLAEDSILNRKVAIKTFKIDSNDVDAIKRFNREASAVSTLAHENIVSIYGVENEEDFYYLILEYVEGTTLKEYMVNNSNIQLETIVYIMKQISDGLFHAHKNGIVHRDIKPQNILLTSDLKCKITDFGISRAYGDTTLTQTNQMLGTVYYLSPEQARGNMATAQSDIYSLGIMMFEMLTGQIPFKGESAVAIALKHLQEELPNVDKYRSGIPQSIKNILIKSTMKNPNERYLSSMELYEDLSTALNSERLNETEYKGFAPLNNNYENNQYKEDYNQYDYEDDYDYDDNYIEEDNINYSNNKNYNKYNSYKEPKKKSSFLQILLAILVIISAIGVSVYTYNYYTTSSKVVVPDLKNIDIKEAKNKIIEAGLKVGEIIEVPSDNVKENIVISSDPSSGKKVAKNSEINLKVSSGKETIDMPNYLGMTEQQVKSMLEKVEFKNVIFEKDQSDEYPEGKVMKQSIIPGSEIVPKDISLTITISTGSKDVEVPSLEGKTLNDIYDVVYQSNLKVGNITNQFSEDVEEGLVISQSYPKGAKVKKDTKIDVVVSKGKDPEKNNKKNINNNNNNKNTSENINIHDNSASTDGERNSSNGN